jgi:hypothetical protein
MNVLPPDDRVISPDIIGRFTPDEQMRLTNPPDDTKNDILYINIIHDYETTPLMETVCSLYTRAHPNINISSERFQAASVTAKEELIAGYIQNIKNILRGDAVIMERPVGGGLDGILRTKILEVLNRPSGGKPRKTSNKKKRYTLHKRRTYKKKRTNSKKIHKRLIM